MRPGTEDSFGANWQFLSPKWKLRDQDTSCTDQFGKSVSIYEEIPVRSRGACS